MMRIGILSDTHNNKENLDKAMQIFEQESVDMLIHCGDLTDVELLSAMSTYKMIYVYGNIDQMTGEIKETLLRQNQENFAGTFYAGEIEGKKIAILHGDARGQLYALIESGRFDYVLHGHSHQYRDEMFGNTHVINPGALGGKHVEPRSVCVLDLDGGKVNKILVE